MMLPEPPTPPDTPAARTHRNKVAGWWVAFAACMIIVIVCGGILIAGMIRTDNGEALIEDPGAVLIGFMALLGAVLTFVAPKLEKIRHQVENSHKTNLRDDLDDKFDQVLSAVEKVDQRVINLDERQTRSDKRIDKVFSMVTDLEDTVNPREKK